MMRSPEFSKSASAFAIGFLLAGLIFAGGLGFADPSVAQSTTDQGDSGLSTQPKRHFRVERPADLNDADALTVYTQVLKEMAGGYELSGDAAARGYRLWQRYNQAPYRSATHGERFVNNYANPMGRAYGQYEEAGALPAGAVLAKDSFAVTARGDVFAGPLFLMEKMPAGFDANAKDWRYTMIMPDGSLFGTSKGQGSEKVEFCVTCHRAAGDEADHLFFIPEEYRVKVMRVQPAAQ